MDIAFLLLRQIGMMLCLMAIGYLMYCRKMISKQGSKELGNILLFAATPCMIIQSFLTECTIQKVNQLMVSYLLAILGLLIAILVSKLVFGSRFPMEHFGSAFSNAGFLGLPLVKMVLGTEAVFYVSAFVVLLNILQWTYGIYVISKRPDVIKFKKILTNPVVDAFMIGLILFFLPVELPAFLSGTLNCMSQMVAPIAMIILGIYLAQTDIVAMFRDLPSYKCSLCRLIVIPLLTILLYTVIPVGTTEMKMALLIAACAPVGANVAVMAQMYDLDYVSAVKPVCLSTILCIITMPLMIALANFIW